MRINVYSQELEKQVELVEKGRHKGIRIYFDGSERLHNTPEDDDRSAITYWLPNNNSFTASDLATVFRKAADLAEKAATDFFGKRPTLPKKPRQT